MQNICYIVTSFDVSFWGEGDTIREGVIGKGRVEGWAGPSGGGSYCRQSIEFVENAVRTR